MASKIQNKDRQLNTQGDPGLFSDPGNSVNTI